MKSTRLTRSTSIAMRTRLKGDPKEMLHCLPDKSIRKGMEKDNIGGGANPRSKLKKKKKITSFPTLTAIMSIHYCLACIDVHLVQYSQDCLFNSNSHVLVTVMSFHQRRFYFFLISLSHALNNNNHKSEQTSSLCIIILPNFGSVGQLV